MPCSSKMTKRLAILLLGHSHRSRCSMIQRYTSAIALVTTNPSRKNCQKTGSCKCRLEGTDVGEERPFSAGAAKRSCTIQPECLPAVCRAHTASPPARCGILLKDHTVSGTRRRKGREAGRARFGLDT